jgi:hypothetical protein
MMVRNDFDVKRIDRACQYDSQLTGAEGPQDCIILPTRQLLKSSGLEVFRLSF